MRTTLDLPEELLAEAQRASGSSTKRETVIKALEALIQRDRRQKLLDMLGKTNLTITQEDINEGRKDRDPPGPDDPLVLLVPRKD